MTIPGLFKKSIIRWWRADPSSLGAALAFYVFFSLTPLFSFALIIFGKIIPSTILEQQIISTSDSFAGPGISAVIQGFLNNTHGLGSNIIASIVGIIVLLFGTLGVFNQLQLSLNRLWDAPRRVGIFVFIREKTLAFIIFLILGGILISSVVATILTSVFLEFISSHTSLFNVLFLIPIGQIITFIATVIVIVFIYSFMTAVPLLLKSRWLGSIGTALFVVVGEYLLRVYLSSYSFTSAYGALGTLAVLLIWVYYSAQIFFFGAAWTYTLDQELRQ